MTTNEKRAYNAGLRCAEAALRRLSADKFRQAARERDTKQGGMGGAFAVLCEQAGSAYSVGAALVRELTRASRPVEHSSPSP